MSTPDPVKPLDALLNRFADLHGLVTDPWVDALRDARARFLALGAGMASLEANVKGHEHQLANVHVGELHNQVVLIDTVVQDHHARLKRLEPTGEHWKRHAAANSHVLGELSLLQNRMDKLDDDAKPREERLQEQISDLRLRLHEVEHHPALEIPPLPNRVETGRPVDYPHETRGPKFDQRPGAVNFVAQDKIDAMIRAGLKDAHRSTLVAYLRVMTDAGDWHAVSDVANDLRVHDARHGK